MWVERGTLRSRGWEVGNERQVRVGWIGLPTKNCATGAWFWMATYRSGYNLGRGDLYVVGQRKVLVVGVHN